MKYFGWILNYSRIRSIRLKSVIHFSESHFWKCISKCPIPNWLKISLHQFDAQESLWRQWKLKRKCSSEVKKIFFPRVLMDMQGGCWRVTDAGVTLLGEIVWERFLFWDFTFPGEYCPSLRSLSVTDCRDVSESSLSKLRHRGVMIDRKLDPVLLRLNRIRQENRQARIQI